MSEILRDLADAVLSGNQKKVEDLSRKAVTMNLSPSLAIEKGLAIGIRRVGELFQEGTLFLPDLMMSAEAMQAGVRILDPVLRQREETRKISGKFLIGTVEGDIHDIGKNIVSAMLEANGFEVIDLGVNVSPEKFLNKITELKPDILGLSALLYTTVPNMEEVIDALNRANLRCQVKVMVGGAPLTREIADKMGADGYGEDAISAVDEATKIMKKRSRGF